MGSDAELEFPDVWFAVADKHTFRGGSVPVLLRHKKGEKFWVSSTGQKYIDFIARDAMHATPQEAIDWYLANQRISLERQSDDLAGTTFTKGQKQ